MNAGTTKKSALDLVPIANGTIDISALKIFCAGKENAPLRLTAPPEIAAFELHPLLSLIWRLMFVS